MDRRNRSVCCLCNPIAHLQTPCSTNFDALNGDPISAKFPAIHSEFSELLPLAGALLYQKSVMMIRWLPAKGEQYAIPTLTEVDPNLWQSKPRLAPVQS